MLLLHNTLTAPFTNGYTHLCSTLCLFAKENCLKYLPLQDPGPRLIFNEVISFQKKLLRLFWSNARRNMTYLVDGFPYSVDPIISAAFQHCFLLCSPNQVSELYMYVYISPNPPIASRQAPVQQIPSITKIWDLSVSLPMLFQLLFTCRCYFQLFYLLLMLFQLLFTCLCTQLRPETWLV